MSTENVYGTIIIGSGPAGLTAAIYSSRARIKTLVIGGMKAGGQLMITTDVENFPGFPDGIMGPELMMNIRKQAQKFGTEIIDEDVTRVDLQGKVKKVYIGDREYQAQTVIVATGASAMWLGLDNETRLMGKGVSGCATCDGAFFRERTVAIVGGGDTAMEEATFLTRFAKKVYLIHRRNEFRASKIMQEKALNNPKIEVIYNTQVEDILGDEVVTKAKLKNIETNEISEIDIQGIFIAIGHQPNTAFLNGLVTEDGRRYEVTYDSRNISVDSKGYVVTLENSETDTTIEGVFVAGDVHDHKYRQAITAAGAGCKAALEVERYLELNNTESAW